MSKIYLVRHGQGGTRHAYDSLSETGYEQASRLGRYFADNKIRFSRAYTGALMRQRQTAAAVASAYGDFPPVEVDPGWNEFDLDHVYRELGPVLAGENEEFRAAYESLRADAGADRRWTPADLKIVQAWIAGHSAYTGESWLAFHSRIAGRREPLAARSREDDNRHIAIFTSATPIAIWAALSLDIGDHRAMRLAGVLYNASYTTMRLLGDQYQLRLHAFNAVPHLEPRMHTYR